MEPNEVPMKRSEKQVKDIEKVLGKKMFLFPKSLANEINPSTMEKCILLRINGQVSYIPVEKKVVINLQEYSLLRDIGVITGDHTYEVNPEFDPLI